MRWLIPFVLLGLQIYAQPQREFLYTILNNLSTHQLEGIDSLIQNIRSQQLKQLFVNEYHFLKDGRIADTISLDDSQPLTGGLEQALAYYLVAKQKKRVKENALRYFTAYKQTFDALDQKKYAQFILKMNNSNELKKKEDELVHPHKHNESLTMQFYSVMGVLGGLFVLALVLYKLYKKNKKNVEKLTRSTIKPYLLCNDKSMVYFINLMYIKADDKYIHLFISGGKTHMVRGTLNGVESELTPNFIRTHRSYIVNRNFVRQVQHQRLFLIDGTAIPLSRTFGKNIGENLKNKKSDPKH